MTLKFDLEHINVNKVDLIVATGRGKTPSFGFVRINRGVREALVEAVHTTWKGMTADGADPAPYDPGNDHDSREFLTLPMDDPLATKARYIYDQPGPEEITNPLEILPRIALYCARIEDESGRRLSAVRKTGDFGRHLQKTKLARLLGQELSLVEEPKFQLENDFDFFIDGHNVLIFRHSGFESACNLQDAIRESVRGNIEYISQEAPFISFGKILEGALKSVKAARVLAGIRAQGHAGRLDQDRLAASCDRRKIRYSLVDGQMEVEPDCLLEFLQLINRQILESEVGPGDREAFFASNRRAI